MNSAWKFVVVGCGLAFLTMYSVSAATKDLRLVEAAKDRQPALVRSLITERVDVNTAQPDGSTALSWAAHWGDLDTAGLLMASGAKPNSPNDYGVTPLALACLNGDPAMVEALLKAGANPNIARLTGETPLMTAARSGNAKVVNLLLAAGANVNVKEERRGQTALMWAVAEKHPDVVQELVDAKADVHVRSTTGFTPLLFAAQQGDVDSGKILVKAGSKVDESSPDNGTPLVVASASGREAMAIFLLEDGANPNAVDSYGVAPLHYALLRGLNTLYATTYRVPAAVYLFRPDMPDLVKALLAHGADPNVRIGMAPPMIPMSSEPSKTEALVVGATPFLLAAATYDVPVMKMLVASGADPKIKTLDGTTALMIAAGLAEGIGHWTNVSMPEPRPEETEKASQAAVELVLKLGADVNEANEDGETAMCAAARIRSHYLIELLAQKGADANARDIGGNTPWTIAEGIEKPHTEGGFGGFGRHVTAQRPRFGPDHITSALLERLGAKPESSSAGFRSFGPGDEGTLPKSDTPSTTAERAASQDKKTASEKN